MPLVDVGDLTFPVRTAGPTEGRPVLLLHGFPQTSYEWRAQLTALGDAGYRALAPDQRGYTATARPPDVDAYRMDELVGDVLGLADALQLERIDLVGHDWGGAVAWHAAGRHPDRIRTLTVCSTPHPLAMTAAIDSGGAQRTMSAYMQVFREQGRAEDLLMADDLVRLRRLFDGVDEIAPYVDAFRDRATLTGALNWYRAMRRSDADTTGDVAVPTLYLWGEDDPALGREAAEGTAAHVTGRYTFVPLPGVGHWVPETAPGTVTEHLLAHLQAS